MLFYYGHYVITFIIFIYYLSFLLHRLILLQSLFSKRPAKIILTQSNKLWDESILVQNWTDRPIMVYPPLHMAAVYVIEDFIMTDYHGGIMTI